MKIGRIIVIQCTVYTLKHFSPYLNLISKCYGIFIDDHEDDKDDNEDDDMSGWVGSWPQWAIPGRPLIRTLGPGSAVQYSGYSGQYEYRLHCAVH